MITEKSVMKTECIFDESRQHRYLLRKEWDSKKLKAAIIMLNPSMANTIDTDMTTLYAIRNLAKLEEFGSMDIINIVSNITVKLNTKEEIQTTPENMEQILKSAERADKIILAFGRSANKKIKYVQDNILENLRPYENKLYVIASATEGAGFHVLAPQVRHTWILQRFEYVQKQAEKEETQQQEKTTEQPLQGADNNAQECP